MPDSDDDDWLQRKLSGLVADLTRERLPPSPHIVLVDDDERWLNAMRTILSTIQVHGERINPQVRIFLSPVQAMEYMQNHRPTILITEVAFRQFANFDGCHLGVTLVRQYEEDPPPVVLHAVEEDIDLLEYARSLAGPGVRIEFLRKTHPTEVAYAVSFLLAQLWEV